MVKMIGVILIGSSAVSLIAGAFIVGNYGSTAQVTGSVISNIAAQQQISMGFSDYLAGSAFSYSIVSFVMGVVFLFMVEY